MNDKIIEGKIVRKSSKYPNYGTTVCGEVYRWDTEKKMKIIPVGGNRFKGDKYMGFRVCHNNKPGKGFLHVIIADCWIPNSDENKTQVNHKNGIKSDYNISNLEWCTPSQNQRHAVSSGLKGQRSELYNSTLSDDQVHLICQRLEDGWLVKDLADLFNVSKDIIRKVKAGDTYFTIRNMYNIPHKYIADLSESTVRWVCERINEGISDKEISALSHNKGLTCIQVKRIRYKIRYRIISDEYF